MTQRVELTEIQFTLAPERDFEKGLLGWVTCVVSGTVRLDGIAVRRTRRGQLRLSFPARHGQSGQQFPYIRPLDDPARREMETQIFRSLRLEENATR